MKISAMVLTLNNEDYIEYTLNSIKDIVDEIVICDGFSKDNTRQIIFNSEIWNNEKVKHLISYTLSTNYSYMRNQCLKRITGDYVLVIDADEIFANSDGTPVTRKQLEKFINQKFEDNQAPEKRKKKTHKADTFDIFTRHFLWNYRTLDGRLGGEHFSQQRLFKMVKGVKQEYQRSVHEVLVWTKNGKAYFPKHAKVSPQRICEFTYPGHAIREVENDKVPTIWHFGHCRGMEQIRMKYRKTTKYEDNPFKAEFKKFDTVDEFCAHHRLFRGWIPIIQWDGKLPSVMNLW
jgi:glycosyltransferase involved in cell wall biosynthesis